MKSCWTLIFAAATLAISGCGGDVTPDPPAPCPADARVFNKLCMTCPAGTTNTPGDDPAGADTSCDAIICPADQHVVSNQCQPCAPGTTNRAGDDASQGDTRCAAKRCSLNEFVADNACSPCPAGYENAAGDDASGSDTACDAVRCAQNQAVTDNVCEPCPPGSTNDAGDDASGRDTDCDLCPAGTFDPGGNVCAPCSEGSVAAEGQTTCQICAAGTYAAGSECLPCPSDLTSSEGATSCQVPPMAPRLSERDYGYLFWPTNHWHRWRQYLNVHHVQTGYYGLTFDVGRASISTLGPLAQAESPHQALNQENSVLASLPGAAVEYAVLEERAQHRAQGFFGRDRAPTNPSELIDMGRFMQRIEIPEVTYSSDDLEGSIQLAAMPRHWVLTHRARTTTGGRPLTITTNLSGDFTAAYPNVEWVEPGRMVTLRDAEGLGWTFVLDPSQGEVEIVRSDDGGLSFRNRYAQTRARQRLTLSVTAIPSTAATPAQLRFWQDRSERITVEFAQMNRQGELAHERVAAPWDVERGVYRIALRNLRDVGFPGGNALMNPQAHNWYNRHQLRITNQDEQAISVPLAFDGGGNATAYIVGGSPLFRDLSGEPTGVPLQISKNWHGTQWYHLYSAMELTTGTHEVELTFAHSKWGEAYATQHAQLSLVGWGQNQQWDESSIGCNGESITYDPDLTLGRAMVDDVRPFLVDAGTRWRWTGNVGGADFLRYFDDQGRHQRLGRLRTHYEYTGPNLTNVVYSGISRDGAVRAQIRTQLGRTDDLVRAYYHFDYEILETIEYRRFALFQVAADRYSDNGFTRYAYGAGANLLFDGTIPNHRTTGYASADQRGIPIDGAAPWVMLYDNQRSGDALPERLANVGFIVRSYRATLGDEVVTTPHINIHRTFNGGFSQMGFELGIPYDEARRVIPAGSRLQAVVEYVIPPADKDAYYGQSEYLLAMPREHFQSTAMLQHLAAENQVIAQALVGSVRAEQPVELEAVDGATAVEFRLSGGLGYVPVTIRGLARPDGWRLERLDGEAWVRVDQSVEGNDYWQAYERSADQTYDLVFNVANENTQTYRLVR